MILVMVLCCLFVNITLQRSSEFGGRVLVSETFHVHYVYESFVSPEKGFLVSA